MKSTTLLAFTTAALLAAGSAFACPKKDKQQSPGEEGVYEVSTEDGKQAKKPCRKNKGDESEEGVYEVTAEDGDKPDADRPERRERGERGDRGDRRRGNPFHGLELTDDQKAEVKEIMEGAREAAKAVREEAKAAKEAGEEVDRQAVMEEMRGIQRAAMKQVYDDVLTDEQQAKVDKRREEMEKRRAEREKDGGAEGDRPRRRGGGEDGERPERRRGGDDDLDL